MTLQESNNTQYVIAIDGGGTSCKAALFTTSNNNAICTVSTGPANVFSNFDLALKNIIAAANQLKLLAKEHEGLSISLNQCHLSAGLAGAKSELVKQKLNSWVHPFLSIDITTDIHIGCIAANDFKDCMLVIVGTGSCIANFKDRTVYEFGGHGFHLGDQASGSWLGKKALIWYLNALDTNVNNSELKDFLEKEVGKDKSAIIENYTASNPARSAELAPKLLALQGKNNEIDAWLSQGASYIVDIISSQNQNETPIYMAGGLTNIYRNIIKRDFNIKCLEPAHSPIFGAYLMAKQF